MVLTMSESDVSLNDKQKAIIHALTNGSQGSTNLQKSLESIMNKEAFYTNLHDLVEKRIIVRIVNSNVTPPRVYYRLSGMGEKNLGKSGLPRRISKVRSDVILSERQFAMIRQLVESMYLFLRVDQLPNGGWGRSISPELRSRYSPEIGAGSITTTSFAMRGIVRFTGNPRHPAIEKATEFLEAHRKPNGSYGPLGAISVQEDRHTIVENCRHTAAAATALMELGVLTTPEMVKSLKFLLKHQKPDCGWGVTSDLSIKDSDCLTTSQVLRTLLSSVETGIKYRLDAGRVHAAILKGIGWLCANQKDGFWIYNHMEEYKTHYTPYVLLMVPELERYATPFFEHSFLQLTDIIKRLNGIPYRTETELPHVGTTAEFIFAMHLCSPKNEYVVVEGIKNLAKYCQNQESLPPIESVTASIVLSLCSIKYLGTISSNKTIRRLDAIAEDVIQKEEKIKTGETHIRTIVPLEYAFLYGALTALIQQSGSPR
jgi:DNA-binding PadR family transcriptional regulator